jgi:2-polyprenyl-3-methyl-5-hydroxy-6-metoxy-1,4-benzoquinol methylase
MSTHTDALHERRLDAARASKGTSGAVIYQMLLDAATDAVRPGDRVLEFGAGTGSLIGMLRASGFPGELTGADILPRPAAIGSDVRWIQGDLNDPLPLADASFDCIVSTEVIEHLENPRAVFREFRRLLRPRGTLLATTPNQASLRSLLSLLFRGHFVAFLEGSYPAHITALVRMDLERICRENGFDPPRFRYTKWGGIPGMPSISWQQISAGLLEGRLFSDNLLLVSRKIA